MKEPGNSVYHKYTGLGRALEGYMKHQTSIRVFKGLYFYYRYSRKLQSTKLLSTPQQTAIQKKKKPTRKRKGKKENRGGEV